MVVSLQRLVIYSVVLFIAISLFLFIHHEFYHINLQQISSIYDTTNSYRRYYKFLNSSYLLHKPQLDSFDVDKNPARYGGDDLVPVVENDEGTTNNKSHKRIGETKNATSSSHRSKLQKLIHQQSTYLNEKKSSSSSKHDDKKQIDSAAAQRGLLFCDGKQVDSEVIYWKRVPGDDTYESPITPHHKDHSEKYITFEYDHGGWNNVRMGIESLVVFAHAVGRTIVFPPQQQLYLLGKKHQDKDDKEPHNVMGFEDFYDIDLLKSHKGLHAMEMKDFLLKEACSGRLKGGKLPPDNSSESYGPTLWMYVQQVADVNLQWQGKFVTLPDKTSNYPQRISYKEYKFDEMSTNLSSPIIRKRIKTFGGHRQNVEYSPDLHPLKLINFPGHEPHRILQHHYAFVFLADPVMQSFYRRFIRDYMRYKDSIQCVGASLVAAVRADALALDPTHHGDFYALHIRRGDMAHKIVKLPASEILQNLHFHDGSLMIPPGSVVYISTDDPKGICEGCTYERIPCTKFKTSPRPEGCPEETSWDAFVKFGWHIKFLHDYVKAGIVKDDVNPNIYGMIETIVCSRAKLFAGTFWSTFTGYIHRLRGYHGLGNATYYHYRPHTFDLQKTEKNEYGWWREWKAGWTEDDGRLI